MLKAVLLLAAMLLLRAATFVRTSVHSQTGPGRVPNPDSVPSEYFTAGSLQRLLVDSRHRKTVPDLLTRIGRQRVNLHFSRGEYYYDTRSDLKVRVKNVFESIFGRQIRQSRQRSCRDLGATPVALVFYRLAAVTYWRLRCTD